MGGRAIKDDMCVCVSVCRQACDCGPEVADTAFSVEINLPVKEGACTCSVLLISSRLDTIKPVGGVV
jgi:hypothetical protein